MIRTLAYPLRSFLLGAVESGGLRWLGPRLPRLPLWWRELWPEMRPRRIKRWGWVLLLAVAIVLATGELGPAASAVAVLP